jgi:putative transposase
MAAVVWRCRALDHVALEQRRTWWGRGQGNSPSRPQPQAALPAIKQDIPEYAASYSQVVQDVLTRLDKAFHAFYRRGRAGETPGYPRLQGAGRYTRCTSTPVGHGARLDHGFLELSKIGRIAIRWSRLLQGAPKIVAVSHEADGWYAGFACAAVPRRPLPRTGKETGIDVWLPVVPVTADGLVVDHPRHPRTAERALQRAPRAGRRLARQETPEGQAPAARWPSPGRTPLGAHLQHDRPGRCAGRQ